MTDEDGRFATPSNLDWGEWQRIVARAYAHITLVDAAGGLLLDKLEAPWLGRRYAGHLDGPITAMPWAAMADASTRAPTSPRRCCACRWRCATRAGSPLRQTSDALACGIDIAPTILDAAGTGFAQPIDGESLLPLANEAGADGRESLLVESYGHGFGTIEPGRAIIKGRYKLIVYQNHEGELYDLEADPYELSNLFTSPRHGEIVSDLEAELRAWLEKTGDTDFYEPVCQAFREQDSQKFQELMQRRARVNDAAD